MVLKAETCGAVSVLQTCPGVYSDVYYDPDEVVFRARASVNHLN